jgi:thiaminase/transcriptional activator TenA
MSLAQQLWQENMDLAQAALHHPFVQGLRTGSLPREYFQRYIAQDAYFLDAFARAYALALAHSPDQQGMHDFFTLLSGVQEELRLHTSYARQWQVSLEQTTPTTATLAYTDFLLATASLHSVGETCAAMTPCMRLYAFLGQTLATAADTDSSTTTRNHYEDWIQTYAAPEFETLAQQLEKLLDRYSTDTTTIHQAYRRAMTLELHFFEAQTAGN